MENKYLHKLDWYIIRKFLGTYFFSIAIILSVAIIFDIQEKIEDFIKGNVALKEIVFDYYLNFIPYFANLFSSLFVFIAVIFFTSKMAAHTEIIAMHEAARALGSWNLSDCTLAVTLEPCPMCAGACIQTHIGTIVFGAWDSKLGACGSIWDIPRDPHIGHAPEVHGGVAEADCQTLLSVFFAHRR